MSSFTRDGSDASEVSPGLTTATEQTTAAKPQDTTRSHTGLEVLVVGTFGGGGIHSYIDKQLEWLDGDVDVSTHDMGMPPFTAGPTRILYGLLLGLYAIVRFPFRTPPDVVHVHTSHQYSFYRSSLYVLFARYVWDVPIILHVHGSSFDEFITSASLPVRILQRHVFAASSEVVALSEYWADILATVVPKGKIRIIPNAVDPALYDGDAGPPHIVFVSNLIERKGVRELVAAIEKLARRLPNGFEVSIAGDGPLAGECERLAATHEEVSYLGYVTEERKRSLLDEGSIFVLPTFAEGLPIAMLEGMAGKNAIVATSVAAIPDVIDENRGVLVDPGEVEQLTDALETLVTDTERRTRLAENNQKAIEKRYSWDRIRTELLDMYEDHVG